MANGKKHGRGSKRPPRLLDDLTGDLAHWLSKQDGVTQVEIVTDENLGPDAIGADHPEIFIGHAYVGFLLDGVAVSMELSYTQ